MKLLEQIERLNRLHQLIKYRRTGTPKELAGKLQLSTSMVYKLLEELKTKEVPIRYSKDLRTYYYTSPFLMNIVIDFRFVQGESKAGG